ncbi:MAG: PH domain-containing protein [Bacteroidetes bacterium]|nr:PH domain-containing protein [Bacteroidota bacterium]MBL7105413.1 PH domain-containing protein [Bacteroidales bacterium]
MKTSLKKSEKIILISKQHWFVLILPIFYTLLIYFLSYIVLNYLTHSNVDNNILKIIILIFFCVYWVYKYIERSQNLWCVTNQRIISEHGVFTNYSKECPVNKINNISYKQQFIGHIFNYGHVQIQTASVIGLLKHKYVKNPQNLKNTITDVIEKYDKVSTSNSNNIADEIEKLFKLKEKGIITEEEFNKRKSILIKK